MEQKMNLHSFKTPPLFVTPIITRFFQSPPFSKCLKILSPFIKAGGSTLWKLAVNFLKVSSQLCNITNAMMIIKVTTEAATGGVL